MVKVDMTKTGQTIRSMMESHNLTPADLRNICGVSNGAVHKWFYGKCVPNIDNLCILADLFGCTINDIIKTEEN